MKVVKKRKERKELLRLIGNRSVLFDIDDSEDDEENDEENDENESHRKNMR